MNLSDISSYHVSPLFEEALLTNLKIAVTLSDGERANRSRSRVPMILVPSHSNFNLTFQLSSIGFVGLVLSLVNAAMNIAQNVSSNNNDRFYNYNAEDIIRSIFGFWGPVARTKMASGDWSPEQNWTLGTRFFSYYFLLFIIPHLVPRGYFCLWRLVPRAYFLVLGTNFFFFC